MTDLKAVPLDDLIPHRTPATADELFDEFASYGAQRTRHGFRIPLPHTVRADGTYDAIEVHPIRPTDTWVVCLERVYRGGGTGEGNITGRLAECDGWATVLVVAALFTKLIGLRADDMGDGTDALGRIITAYGVGPR